MAKGSKLLTKYQNEMQLMNVHKKYLARVAGKIKESDFVVDKPLYCSNAKNARHAVAETPEALAVSKQAKTTFKVIWYDEESDTSLVECQP